MTNHPVAGIDPGKSGYQCALLPAGDGNPSLIHPGELHPVFWPSCVQKNGDYDLPRMVEFANVLFFNRVRLVALEQQAPRGHGTREQLKWGIGREGNKQSFELGFGLGCWKTALVAAGFKECPPEKAGDALSAGGSAWFTLVDPMEWKSRMGATAHHSRSETQSQRKKANDARSIEAAQALAAAQGLSIDLRPLERSPGARTPSPDKACSFLLASYAKFLIDREGAPQADAGTVAERAARVRAEIKGGE